MVETREKDIKLLIKQLKVNLNLGLCSYKSSSLQLAWQWDSRLGIDIDMRNCDGSEEHDTWHDNANANNNLIASYEGK